MRESEGKRRRKRRGTEAVRRGWSGKVMTQAEDKPLSLVTTAAAGKEKILADRWCAFVSCGK